MFVYTKEMVKELIEQTVMKDVSYSRKLRPIEEMSPSQRKKMFSLFTHPCNYEDAIFFYDATMFGSGKKGFVVTKDAIYFTEDYMRTLDSNVKNSVQVLSYQGIRSVTCKFDGAENYLWIVFTNNRSWNYTFHGMEACIAAILTPIVDIRLEAERLEREEKRIRYEERKKQEAIERRECLPNRTFVRYDW